MSLLLTDGRNAARSAADDIENAPPMQACTKQGICREVPAGALTRANDIAHVAYPRARTLCFFEVTPAIGGLFARRLA